MNSFEEDTKKALIKFMSYMGYPYIPTKETDTDLQEIIHDIKVAANTHLLGKKK